MQQEDLPTERTRSSIGTVLVVVLLGAVAALVIGLGSWIPVSYSGVLYSSGPCGAPCPTDVLTNEAIPPGVNVTVQWATSSGGEVTFYVLGEGRPVLLTLAACGSTGVSGSCSFPSEAKWYHFGAVPADSQVNQTVDFTWSYLVPII
jgi:hypothetical protein